MLFNRTNVHQKLLRERGRGDDSVNIMAQVQRIFDVEHARENRIKSALNDGHTTGINTFDFDQLETDRIFHENTIKKICINYRLRFLDTHYFKGEIPHEAISEIKHLERTHDTSLSNFKIIAPSKMFVLHKTDDPLLFAPMGNGYYYLIHKWGNDLHPFRKIMMWPFKSFENLLFTILLSSVLATMMIPQGLFTRQQQSFSQDIMVFFFMFKSIAAIVLFYGFAQGKNFNTAIWQSKFDKAQ